MNSRQAAREIAKAAMEGDVDTANRLFNRALYYAETGRLEARRTIPDWALFTVIAGFSLFIVSGAIALVA